MSDKFMSEPIGGPAQVFCLPEMMADEMKARGWRTEDVAARMGTPKGAGIDLLTLDLFMGLYAEKGLLMSDDFFAGLARAFDISEQYFRNIHASWLKYPDRRAVFECPDELFGPISRRQMIHPVSDAGR